MKFARNVFLIAGLWGIVVLTPLYFVFDWIGARYPPGITHPDFFYGFIGTALAWQVGFLIIARNPGRLRPMIIAAILQKFGYVITLTVLYAEGRLQADQAVLAMPDFVLGVLFIAAFLLTSPASKQPAEPNQISE